MTTDSHPESTDLRDRLRQQLADAGESADTRRRRRNAKALLDAQPALRTPMSFRNHTNAQRDGHR